ncbi:MAG: PAS domain S-box protein, partial [Verrucomicrobia bacterium]
MNGKNAITGNGRRLALKVSLLYAGVAALWILLSDYCLGKLVSDTVILQRLAIFKGWTFVAVTAVCLYWTLHRELKRREQEAAARREAEQALLHERALLRTLLDSIPDLIFFKDKNSIFLGCNKAFEDFCGLSQSEIVGRNNLEHVTPEMRATFRRQDQQTLSSGAPLRVEEWIPSGNGGGGQFETVKTAFRGPDGEVLGLIAISRDITERKQMEASLRSERDFSARIIREAPAIIGGIAPDGTIAFINPSGEAITGYGSSEIVGKNWWRLFYPGHEYRQVEQLLRDFERGDVKDYEMVLTTRGGRKRTISWNSINRRDDNGKLVEIVGFGNDVTERKQVEEQLRQMSERLMLATSAAGVGIWDWDVTNDLLVWDDRMCWLYGFNPDRFPGAYKAWRECVHPDDRARAEEAVQRALRCESDFNTEFRVVLANGSIRHIKATGVVQRNAAGGTVRMVGTNWEITEIKRAEEQLRKHSRAVEQSPASIVITDRNGNIEYVNPKFTEITGYALDEVRGKNPRLLKSGETSPEEYRRLWQTISAGREWRGEFHNRKKNGEQFWEFASISPIVDEGGNITHFLAVKEDITARKRAEAERRLLEDHLRQTQKMEAFGQLAGGVAHDFNNILAATLIHLGLMKERRNLDAETLESIHELESHAQRAASLTRQLLLFGRRSVMQVRPLDLNEAVENLLKMLRRLIGEHITLEWQGRSVLPRVLADAGMIEQIVVNLVVNARDAMPKGGIVTIATSLAEVDAAQAQAEPHARPGQFACLTVSDTGCGMDETVLRRIFEPFFTTKDTGKGTGLGLATVYGIVNQHQGWIAVESTVDKGSVFRIFLPALNGSHTDTQTNA